MRCGRAELASRHWFKCMRNYIANKSNSYSHIIRVSTRTQRYINQHPSFQLTFLSTIFDRITCCFSLLYGEEHIANTCSCSVSVFRSFSFFQHHLHHHRLVVRLIAILIATNNNILIFINVLQNTFPFVSLSMHESSCVCPPIRDWLFMNVRIFE